MTVGENTLRTDSVSGTEKFQLKITFVRRCTVEKVFSTTLLKKDSGKGEVIPVNFAKVLETQFLENTSSGCFCIFE